MTVQILVVEDGFEYTEAFRRFHGERFEWTRAESGPEALVALEENTFELIFLDMCFDRTDSKQLFGDYSSVADRFNGDPVQAKAFLENHQGNFILAAIREAGHGIPVLLSYDFDLEPRRWEHLRSRFGPVGYVVDAMDPSALAQQMLSMVH